MRARGVFVKRKGDQAQKPHQGSSSGYGCLGYIAEHASVNAAWIIGGMVLVVSLGLYWQVDVRQRKSPVRLNKSLAEA